MCHGLLLVPTALALANSGPWTSTSHPVLSIQLMRSALRAVLLDVVLTAVAAGRRLVVLSVELAQRPGASDSLALLDQRPCSLWRLHGWPRRRAAKQTHSTVALLQALPILELQRRQFRVLNLLLRPASQSRQGSGSSRGSGSQCALYYSYLRQYY